MASPIRPPRLISPGPRAPAERDGEGAQQGCKTGEGFREGQRGGQGWPVWKRFKRRLWVGDAQHKGEFGMNSNPKTTSTTAIDAPPFAHPTWQTGLRRLGLIGALLLAALGSLSA